MAWRIALLFLGLALAVAAFQPKADAQGGQPRVYREQVGKACIYTTPSGHIWGYQGECR